MPTTSKEDKELDWKILRCMAALNLGAWTPEDLQGEIPCTDEHLSARLEALTALGKIRRSDDTGETKWSLGDV